MNDTLQKKAFMNYEGDAWFKRNESYIHNYDPQKDAIISLLLKYQTQPKNILEIGCSSGYRLNALKQIFPHAQIHGIDPSIKAIEYGKSIYANIKLNVGTIDDLNAFSNQEFDLIIVGFVFYVVDRNILLKSIAEIDRILLDKNLLIITDFYSEKPSRRVYQHINDIEAFSYKQNYESIFLATHLYHLLSKDCFDHKTSLNNVDNDFQESYSISLLKKDLNASYK